MINKMLTKEITSDHKLVFLFSGQGTHYCGMGEKLFATNSTFANTLERMDSYVQKNIGKSLIEELFYKKNTPFDDLLITHPAIVSVELALWSVLREAGITPDYVSGNSLGEFAATVACGIWKEEEAVEAAIAQAQFITKNNEKGGMLTILNIHPHVLEHLLTQHNLFLASHNFPGHYTLSGSTSGLSTAEVELKSLKIPYMRLPVAYPFHSPLLQAGEISPPHHTDVFPSLIQPAIGLISGLYVEELSHLPSDYFSNVASQPVHFIKLVSTLEKKSPCLYVDLGPSGVSASFVSNNLRKDSDSMIYPIMTPFGQDDKQLQKLFQLLEAMQCDS